VSFESYIGRAKERSDTVWPPLKQRLAATLNQAVLEGDELPALWHWALFQDWAPASALGADGHSLRGAFLPEEPAYPRRMWAGGQISFERPLRVGQDLTRGSRIVKIAEKHGSTGPALWVSIEHVITDDQGTLLSEQQHLVYRAADSISPPVPLARPAAAGAVSEHVPIDSVLLFRYSALTGNSHRIHYDQDYARNREGYAGLVVHGALQATLLAGLIQRQEPDRRLCQFAFRARWPAVLERCPLLLEAWRVNEHWQMRSRDREGSLCMTAEARFAF
jgi:hydroxyacyl-ACP dehydratase HTD2-like protein with hotdog domain